MARAKAGLASGKPTRLSVAASRISCTPRALMSVSVYSVLSWLSLTFDDYGSPALKQPALKVYRVPVS